MMFCNGCGTLIPDGSAFCPACGKRLAVSYSAPVAEATRADIHMSMDPNYNAQILYNSNARAVENYADQVIDELAAPTRYSFSLSLICFWVKGYVEVDYRFLRTSTANTALGWIVTGTRNESIPLKQVSSVDLDTNLSIGSLVWGVLVFLATLPTIILAPLGLLMIVNSFQTRLRIHRAGNKEFDVKVPFYERSKMEKVRFLVEQGKGTDADKTDLGMYFAKRR